MWKCPKCNREFAKNNQSHVCSTLTVDYHFKNKHPIVKELYEEFKKQVLKKVGPFKVDVPKCCIHFVKRHTFAEI